MGQLGDRKCCSLRTGKGTGTKEGALKQDGQETQDFTGQARELTTVPVVQAPIGSFRFPDHRLDRHPPENRARSG